MKKMYTEPDMKIIPIKETVVTANSNELPILSYDPDDPALDKDSREFDVDYARRVGLA